MDPAMLVKLLTTGGLVTLMLSVGFQVRLADVLAPARHFRAVVPVLLANFVLIPAVTIGILSLYDADPLVAAGFVILAVCAGAPVGPQFAGIARGDVPLAVTQMVLLAGLSTILSPFLLRVLLQRMHVADKLQIDYAAIAIGLLVTQLLPLVAGLGLHHVRPQLTEQIARPLGAMASVLLLAAVVVVLFREYESLALIRLRGWVGMVALLAASLVIGWLCGGPGGPARRSLAVTTGVRNAAAGLVIVSGNFAGTPAVTAVVAFSVVSIFGTLGCALLMGSLCRTQLQAAVGPHVQSF